MIEDYQYGYAQRLIYQLLYRVGMIFLPNDDKLAAEAREIVEQVVAKEGRCKVKAWRDVPVAPEVVGPLAKLTEPRVVQASFHHIS